MNKSMFTPRRLVWYKAKISEKNIVDKSHKRNAIDHVDIYLRE